MLYNLFLVFSLLALNFTPAQAREGGTVSQIWNVPRQEHNFIGRSERLDQLSRHMSTDQIVAIVGLAGIGKTSLAKEYAITHRHKYHIVWFIDARRDIETQFYELAIELSEKGLIKETFSSFNIAEGAKACLEYLNRTSKAYLLIYDNIEGSNCSEDLIPEVKEHQSCHHVIITTRRSADWIKSLQITAFSGIESIRFLADVLQLGFSDEDMSLLADTLGHHPRALLQASAHIARSPGMTCRKYVELFKSNNRKLNKDEKLVLSKQEASVELHSSLQALISEVKSASPQSIQFLATLCLFSCSRIDEELLVRCQDMLGHDGAMTFKHLLETELISKTEKYYSIHPYVATVVLNGLSAHESDQSVAGGLKVLSSYLKQELDGVIPVFGEHPHLLDHILEMTSHYQGVNQLATDLEVAALYYIFYLQRRYELSDKLAEQCKKRLEQRGTHHPSLSEGRFYSIYSFAVYDFKTVSEAIQEALKAEQVLKQIKTDAAREELIILLTNNLAWFYGAQGDNSSSWDCVNRAYEVAGTPCSLKHYLYISFLEIACAIDDSNFDEARRIIPEHLEKLKGHELEPFAAHLVNAMAAKVELKDSNLELATVYANKAYDQACKSVGNDEKHETVARVGIFLATCELLHSRPSRAKQLIDNAIESFALIYKSPNKHRIQAYAYMVKADILIAENNLNGGMDYYAKALKIYNEQFTSFKIDDVSELYLKMVSLGIKMKDEFLCKDYLERHIEVFGLKHPRTIQAMQALKDAGMSV